jgi:pyruvate,water dikinase
METLKGVGASGGKVKARACIVLTHEQNLKMGEGEVLVTKMTTPLFTPAIMKASALVTDVGGMLSHAAIIARELGIPCVVDTKEATKRLNDGDLIIVNGDEGIIQKP